MGHRDLPRFRSIDTDGPHRLRLVDVGLDRIMDGTKWSQWFARPAGDIWPCPYRNHRFDTRPPCHVVRMPNKAWVWHTNDVATNGSGFWDVSWPVGHPELLTVNPSIHIVGFWHGFIRAGLMTVA